MYFENQNHSNFLSLITEKIPKELRIPKNEHIEETIQNLPIKTDI